MKIIILGAGQVGSTLAEHFATEHNDITVVDVDGDRLRALQERMDILTITGNAAYPTTLKRGGAAKAELLIAVTSSDEVNLVACQVATTLFQIPTKIARIRSLDYLAHQDLFGTTSFPINVLISPEQVIANYIHHLIEYPDALQVLDFADRTLALVAVKVHDANAALVGQPIQSLPYHLENIEIEIAVIFRNEAALIPNGDTVIQQGDEVFFLAKRDDIQRIMSFLTPLSPSNQRIIIAGGGNIGTRLAAVLEEKFQIKVIEENPDKVETLASHLKNGIVLQGDASDKTLLLSENIENTDIFCTVTNQDETNILSALLAKHLGAHKVIALINRSSYLDLIDAKAIDNVISPQKVTIGSLLTHVRRGHIINVYSLKQDSAEAVEMLVDNNPASSKIIGHTLKDISLQIAAHAIAIIRGQQILMRHTNPIVNAGDRLILILLDKGKALQLEQWFQTGSVLF